MSSQSVANVVYTRTPDGPIGLDLFLPERPRASRLPVVLWLHGGGWAMGDRTLAPDLAARAAATGMAYASIDYRLSGTATFPAQLLDVRAGVRFLRTESGRWGLDPDAIGLWGGSAGGHLALLAGLTGHVPRFDGETDAGDAKVGAVAASYAPVDLGALVDESTTRQGTGDPAMSFEARLLGGLPSQVPDLAELANPLTHVHDDAPPLQLSHGTGDVTVPPDHSIRLHEALRDRGAPSELYLLDGYRHGFLNPAGRLDVSLQLPFDDGRLEAEGMADALYRHGSGDERPGRFGFSTIDEFFTSHLAGSGSGRG